MAKQSTPPEYELRVNWPGPGRMVKLGEVIVPQRVTATLTGGGEIEGRIWPDIFISFEIRDGASVCNEFRIVSGPKDRPIRTPDLSFIDLDNLAALCFQSFAATPEADGGYGLGGDTADTVKPIRDSIAASYKEPLAELKAVARVYCNPNARAKPASSVFMSLSYKSQETANRRIRAARTAGLIPPVGASDAELDAAWKRLEGDEGE